MPVCQDNLYVIPHSIQGDDTLTGAVHAVRDACAQIAIQHAPIEKHHARRLLPRQIAEYRLRHSPPTPHKTARVEVRDIGRNQRALHEGIEHRGRDADAGPAIL